MTDKKGTPKRRIDESPKIKEKEGQMPTIKRKTAAAKHEKISKTGKKTIEAQKQKLRAAQVDQAFYLMHKREYKQALRKLEQALKIERGDKVIVQATLLCASRLQDKHMARAFKCLRSKVKKNEQKIREALPHFTEGLKYAAKTLKYRVLLPSVKELPTSAKMAFSLSSVINQELSGADFKNFSEKKTLTEQDKKTLARFINANAELLSVSYPKRKSSIWQFMKVASKPNQSPQLESKDHKPIRVDKKERLMLGIAKIDPIAVLEFLAEYVRNSPSAEIRMREAEIKMRELTLKLSYSLNLLKSGKILKREPKEQKKEREKITMLIQKLKQYIPGIKASEERRNDKEFQKIANKVTDLIKSENQLLKSVEISKQNEEWPEEKRGKESIDPRVETLVNVMTINLFLEAIKMNSEDESNYRTLFRFLEKIGFDKVKPQVQFEKKFEKIKRLKERKSKKEAFAKLSKEINNLISRTLKLHSFLEEGYKKIPETINPSLKIYLEIIEKIQNLWIQIPIVGMLPMPPPPYETRTLLLREYRRRKSKGLPDAESYLPPAK